MEVTRKNFKETLPLVSESIQKAEFLVIDAEFTGLINGRDVSIFDTPEQYYYTVLDGSSEFLLIQFGLCAFYWDDNEKHYMNDAYNFYLFPRGRPGPERMFLCQSSSLDFLAAQGFDFNKLIREGISYMTEPCETRLRENLTERQKSYNNDSHIKIPEENQPQIDDICKRVRKFLDDKDSNEMEIDRCNAFIRRLLFQELGSKFKDEAFFETKVLENKDRVLKVTRITSENDGKSRDMLKKEKEWEEFEDAVGFSKVARMISQSEKLVIGHNMLLDLMHTLNHFFQPLPPAYGCFKEFAHCMFPKVLDTKYMSSLPPFKDKVNSSVLSHLLATLSEAPFSLPKADCVGGRGYTLTHDRPHEAGYDAYVTGLCFLAMLSHLARMRGEQLAPASQHQHTIKPFLNKIFLAKTAHQDSPYMNLTGPDPNPPRDHVFHLTFPKEWTRNDLNQLFSPFCAVSVQFVDDTSAFVALGRRDAARDVQRALSHNARVSLTPFARYKQTAKPLPTEQGDYRRDFSPMVYANTPDSSPRAKSESKPVNSFKKQNLPEKVERAAVEAPVQRPRSNSASPAAQPHRKRTSSGVFQVDDAEPPLKKPEVTRSESDGARKKPEGIPNGRRKTSESEATGKKEKRDIEATGKKEKRDTEATGKKEKRDTESTVKKEKENAQEKTKIVEKFDANAKSNCVSAFKESDSWD